MPDKSGIKHIMAGSEPTERKVKNGIPNSAIDIEETSAVISAIKDGSYDMQALDTLYREAFVKWARRRFYTTPEYIDDAWQEAMYALYKNIKSGKLREMSCSFKTMLFRIGYNWLAKTGRKLKHIWWSNETDLLVAAAEVNVAIEDDVWEDEKILLRAAMEHLSPQCREMLVMRHIDGYSVEDIMEKFKYKNKNATSVSISACFANLKEIIKKMSVK